MVRTSPHRLTAKINQPATLANSILWEDHGSRWGLRRTVSHKDLGAAQKLVEMAGGTDEHRLRHYKPKEIVKSRRVLCILRQVDVSDWRYSTCELGLGEALIQ